jgi:hypothetical protein
LWQKHRWGLGLNGVVNLLLSVARFAFQIALDLFGFASGLLALVARQTAEAFLDFASHLVYNALTFVFAATRAEIFLLIICCHRVEFILSL